MAEKHRALTLTENSLLVLEERYLLRDEKGELSETPLQLFQRVAEAIAKAEENYGKDTQAVKEAFLNTLLSLDFLPNSPTLMNAGTSLGQLAACFVLPVEDSIEGIYKTVRDAAIVQSSGGGVGFTFSKVRPRGDAVRSTGGMASGPLSFMQVFDATTECIKQSRKRRGANMGILNVDPPDIEEFVKSKSNLDRLNNFNISVGMSDAFFEALNKDDVFQLINPRTNEAIKVIKAKDLFNQIVNMAWLTGDPGMVFLDKINQDNPTPHLGPIESTNPCGETPLLPYECCILGSVNISNMVEHGQIDWARLANTVRTGIRFLDNEIDVNAYPIPEIKKMTLATRKIGLGIMGWADALIKLQIPYDSEDGILAAEEVMEYISFHARSASIQLARERGRFPKFKGSIYARNPYCVAHEKRKGKEMLQGRPTLDWTGLVKEIVEHGIRNATVTTIAPTGSISTLANVSSGIEPIFALSYKRHIVDRDISMVNDSFKATGEELGFDNAIMQRVMQQGNLVGIDTVPEQVHRIFVTALEIDSQWHVRMQAAFQRYVDNAVSKTVNLRGDAKREDVANVYLLAHKLGCKGITIYRDGSRKKQILTGGLRESTQIIPMPRMLPDGLLPAKSFSTKTPTGRMYLFIREIDKKPMDAFVILGRSGSDITAFTEAIGRLLSICLRSNIPIDILAENLMGLGGRTSIGLGPKRILSVPDAIGKFLHEAYGEKEDATRRGEICPDCKNTSLEFSEGCLKCPVCGFAEC
ncbi:MAG: ribonucleoside-diphosphate reductase alpha chain [Anaerolineaceae bacterium]|nr:MAG: ribonucleoside-diphosphate reductase alpha chain [Anaerolineaceae bacterium]